MLKSKCILSSKKPEDGTRISIMSRHTLNDGKTPDERITEDSFDIHQPELGPEGRLIGRYYRDEIAFEEYKKEYETYLYTKQKEIGKILQQANVGNITVMCIEESPEHCHRKIFIETSEKIADTLGMNITTKIE